MVLQTLSSVLQLKVNEADSRKKDDETSDMEGGEESYRSYTYDELLDLQSRLMLVAGQAEKGKDNVDRFLNVSVSGKMPHEF